MYNKKKIKVLVLAGDGINADMEIDQAYQLLGASVNRIHINQLITNKRLLHDYNLMILPGGFSYGDHLGSGKILATKIKAYLKDEIQEFLHHKKMILGVCNGFQVLAKLNLLPEAKLNDDPVVALEVNSGKKFINKWASLHMNFSSSSPWGNTIRKHLCSRDVHNKMQFMLPIRHGEGRFCLRNDLSELVAHNLKSNNQILFQYCNDINGSYENIAGIVDVSGFVLGLMPHPEAAIEMWQHPSKKQQKNQSQYLEGYYILKGAVDYYE